MSPETVLKFWFEELTPKDWFAKSDKLDAKIRINFSETLNKAKKCELKNWRKTIQGRLAEIIVLDQFSRNLFRGSSEAFASDTLALALSQEAIAQGLDQELSLPQKTFLYMPYMHSESKVIHEEAVKLFSIKGLEFNLDYELKHKVIIDRFGRYPHRNEVLKRKSTPEELEFLKTENSSF